MTMYQSYALVVLVVLGPTAVCA